MDNPEKAKIQYSSVEDIKIEYGFGCRHLQIFLVFMMLVMSYVIRTSMSIGVIAMTDVSKNDTGIEIFEWDKKTQDIVLSSFYWGYMINQLPAGHLSHKYGPKILLTIAMLGGGMIFILMPYLISMGAWKAAYALRMLQGLTQSALLPSTHNLLSKWAPVEERSRLGNFIIGGAPFGTIIGMTLTGYLSKHYDWTRAFQTIGSMAIVTGIFWIFLGYNNPAIHPRISDKERKYIETSLGQSSSKKVLKTPWKSFFKSKPLWALIFTHIGMNWTFVTLLLEIPSYLKMGLGIDVQNSGILSALPYLAMWVSGFIISFITDYLVIKKYCTISVSRKLANSFGVCSLGICLIILSFIPTNQVLLCEIVLIVGVGLFSGINVGIMLNHIDLSPNFSGILMGITNTIANGCGTFAPITAGYILQDPTDPSQWRKVFFFTVAISFAANLIFVIFGTSEVQPWNEPEKKIDVEMSEMKNDNGTDKKLLTK